MCTQPIWIANRSYTRKDHDISLPMSNLAQRPWDVARFRLLVPCGQCEECLKRLRNDWYVRLRQELARCRQQRAEAWFITITIHPRYYRRALNDPTWFIRKWLERVRHVTGRSIKHAFFQEFGTHSTMGSEPRLHFHGFLFDPRMRYNTFRRIVAKFGFVWLGQATPKRARYCVKYVVKQLNTSDYELPDKFRLKLSDRKYTRKFVSPGVGDFLGTQPRPSFSTSTWNFDADVKNGGYTYRIPRYYDRYLAETEKIQRAIVSAASYACYFADNLVIDFLRSIAPRYMVDPASLSFNKGPFSQMLNYVKYSESKRYMGRPFITLDFKQVIPVWKQAFGLEPPEDVIFNKSLTYG